MIYWVDVENEELTDFKSNENTVMQIKSGYENFHEHNFSK